VTDGDEYNDDEEMVWVVAIMKRMIEGWPGEW
jgi:hypothetical protein